MKWSEVEKCARSAKGDAITFDAAQILKRFARLGDLFAPMLTLRQRLPTLAALAHVPDRAFAKLR